MLDVMASRLMCFEDEFRIQGNFDFPTWVLLGKHDPKHTCERARKVIERQAITV
jgi:hypothetical protein